jgi:hypothetical protein
MLSGKLGWKCKGHEKDKMHCPMVWSRLCNKLPTGSQSQQIPCWNPYSVPHSAPSMVAHGEGIQVWGMSIMSLPPRYLMVRADQRAAGTRRVGPGCDEQDTSIDCILGGSSL